MSFDDNWMDQSRRLAIKGQSGPAGEPRLGAEPPPAIAVVRPLWVYHGVFVADGALQRALLRRGRPVAVSFDLYDFEGGPACTTFPYPPREMWPPAFPVLRAEWYPGPVAGIAVPPREERVEAARRLARRLLESWAEGA